MVRADGLFIVDQAGLAAMVAYDRASIGGVVGRLEDRGWLERRTDDADRRARRLLVTDKGAVLLGRLTPVVVALQPLIVAGLTKAEADELARLMQKILSE